ncbi:hypothetical protein [Paenarthrobacter nitroguajacolicus]|uniref:hypothetical protein n=1 Tax=Paenarthrobacter nitroguajacolicus TaxID=211146 RepID=UPI00405490F7
MSAPWGGAVDFRFAKLLLNQAGSNVEKSGLSTPTGTHDGHEFVFLDLKIHIVKCFNRPRAGFRAKQEILTDMAKGNSCLGVLLIPMRVVARQRAPLNSPAWDWRLLRAKSGAATLHSHFAHTTVLLFVGGVAHFKCTLDHFVLGIVVYLSPIDGQSTG